MRFRHLTGAMLLEEKMQRARTVPSAFTLLKAEYGLIGNRREVLDRKSTRLNSSHIQKSRMPSSA